jgi:copper chaperone NosL
VKHLLSLALFLVTSAACDEASRPEELVKGRDVCALCRMPVSDPHFAAQITAPGELPLFFDDPGCFAEFVRSGQVKTKAAAAWVADHRTGVWVRADRAIYTRVSGLATPMSHHLVAHESAASRDSDPEVKGGQPASLQEIFGPQGPPTGATS